MHPTEPRAFFWTRLFQCETYESAEREARAARGEDPELALLVWRAHRASEDRADSRLEERARDLEALQSFGRALAEARTVEDLFVRAATSLQALTEADAVALASVLPDRNPVELHLARSITDESAVRLREAVALGFVPVDPDAVPAARLPVFDRFQGPRVILADTDIVVVPIERRGRELVRVAIVPRHGPTERCVRAAFGASNHLAVHLDRVLAVTEAEQGRFRAILDSMPHAVVLTDGSFQVVQANVSATHLLPRLGPDAASSLRSLGDLDLLGVAYDVLAGRRTQAEGEARLADGGVLEVAVAPWRNAAGRTDGLVIVMLDVTTAKRLREQVAQSEKLVSLGRMIAGVAHELNNPLTSVIGYAQLLRAKAPGDTFGDRLDTIRKEADRCRRIVQNLLRFARVHTPERKAYSLNELVESTAQLLSYGIRSSGCRLVLELDRALPSLVGDAHEVGQALVNLVTNAQQAMTLAEMPGAITLRTSSGEGRVVLEVDDQGPGVSDDVKPKLFDPFFTTKASGQGTGLGLWLASNAVVSQGGSIAVGASPSGGARFRLEFPCGAGGPAPVEAGASDEVETEPRVSARILVVDPEAALAELICEALGAEGHRPTAALDADEALRRLTDETFDLVVSDAALPGLSGERLAREFERIQPHRRGRILLTTGDWVSREPEAIARRLDAGLLRKPFELDELRRVVRTHLHRDAEH